MSYHCIKKKVKKKKEKSNKNKKKIWRTRLKVAEARAYHFFCHAINITSA